MTSYNQDNKVGPWAVEKLKCLGDYLSAYTTILNKQYWCSGYFYIDAFAGAGINEIRKPKFNDPNGTPLMLFDGLQGRSADKEEYVLGLELINLYMIQ